MKRMKVPCIMVNPTKNRKFTLTSEENGGNKTYTEFSEFEADFISGALHPADVKPSLSKALNTILQPVRDHFKNNKEAAALLKQGRSYKTTR